MTVRTRLALGAAASAGLAAAALAVLPSRAADAAKPAAAAPATAEEGFTPLFNGTDLTGWTYGTKPAKVAATPPTGASAAAGTPATKPAMAASENKAGKGYQVRPGGILYSTKDDGGNLYTEKEYKDFVFRFEFKLTENANNGIGIRAPLTGDSAYQGMEIQVLDDSGSMYTKLRPAQYHGSVYDVFPAKRGSQKPVGEWNTEEIRVQGTKVTVTVNGQVITDADLSTVVDPAVLKKHPGLKNEKGHIGFLGHGAEVEFRNVRVKEL